VQHRGGYANVPVSPPRSVATITDGLTVIDLATKHAYNPDAPVLLGTSHVVRRLLADIQTAARSDATILITGPTGAGKELVAALLHASSQRAGRPFVTLNCAAVPESLIESELFGHLRGSFTDAHQDRQGLALQADHGTLFLDEIGEMSPRMQAVVLRFTETGEVRPVGDSRLRTFVNTRIIAATNRHLPDRIASGDFRQDLYYRLNVIPIVVPPLRERGSDIALLFEHFLEHYARVHHTKVPTLSDAAIDVLLSYSWPGNIRELKNLTERIIVRNTDDVLTAEALPLEMRQTGMAHSTGVNGVATIDYAHALGDVVWRKMIVDGESFWTAVQQPFIDRELTKSSLRYVIRRGVEEMGGNYRKVSQLFNVEAADYKRFLAFLYQQDCHLLAVEPVQPRDGRTPLTPGRPVR
jgi:DNA-binding NtrC family response regulator